MIFYHTNELEIPELANAKINQKENYQDNGATPRVNTQTSLQHSPQEDTLVASDEPLPRPRIEAADAALQAQEGDLLDVRLLGAEYMLYGVYQDWVNQNPGDHLDGGIAEDSKWQAQWEKLACMLTQHYDIPSGKFGKIFVGVLSIELDRVCARKWNAERMIVFNFVILQLAQDINNYAQIRKRILF